MEKEEKLKMLLSGIKVECMVDPKFPKGGQIAGSKPMITIISHPDVELKIELGEPRGRWEQEKLGRILFELAIKEIFKL